MVRIILLFREHLEGMKRRIRSIVLSETETKVIKEKFKGISETV